MIRQRGALVGLVGAALLAVGCAEPFIRNTVSPYCARALDNPPGSPAFDDDLAAYQACRSQREYVERVPRIYVPRIYVDPGPYIPTPIYPVAVYPSALGPAPWPPVSSHPGWMRGW
jgi:hypothetical protein